MTKPTTRLFILSVMAFSCLGIDQATKSFAAFALKEGPSISFMNNLFRLQYMENRGAFLSLGAELPDYERWFYLTGIATLILVVLAIFLCFYKQLSRGELFGYGLILAGGISNMVDRIASGFVVDFLNVGIGSVRTGIFNIADIAILLGLFWVVLFHLKSLADSSPQDAANQL